MRILLLRHGQTPSNVLGLLDSRVPGPDLTELGRAQAAAIPAALAGLTISSITASTMVRTAQTITPLASALALPIDIAPGVREIGAGDLEMASGKEALRKYVAVAWGWAGGDLDVRMVGSENGHEFFDRFDSVVDALATPGEEVPVIASHGGSIRVWVGNRCGNVQGSFAADSPLHNTGSALVEHSSAHGWQLIEWNPHPLGGLLLHGKSGPEDNDPTGPPIHDVSP